jgi:hypothetical protein
MWGSHGNFLGISSRAVDLGLLWDLTISGWPNKWINIMWQCFIKSDSRYLRVYNITYYHINFNITTIWPLSLQFSSFLFLAAVIMNANKKGNINKTSKVKTAFNIKEIMEPHISISSLFYKKNIYHRCTEKYQLQIYN